MFWLLYNDYPPPELPSPHYLWPQALNLPAFLHIICIQLPFRLCFSTPVFQHIRTPGQVTPLQKVWHPGEECNSNSGNFLADPGLFSRREPPLFTLWQQLNDKHRHQEHLRTSKSLLHSLLPHNKPAGTGTQPHMDNTHFLTPCNRIPPDSISREILQAPRLRRPRRSTHTKFPHDCLEDWGQMDLQLLWGLVRNDKEHDSLLIWKLGTCLRNGRLERSECV